MIQLLFFALGLVALVAGAELMVRGSSRLALSLGISPLVVGLTVVAFGTSAPEFAVSVQSAWSGRTDLALSNVIGSNIFNVLFVLGLSALITPLLVDRQLIRQEVPVMVGATLLLVALSLDGHLSRLDGAVLFALLAAYTTFVIVQSRRQSAQDDDVAGVNTGASTWDATLPVQLALIVAGLVLLVLGAHWLVEAAVSFARSLGVSEVVIGLTVVAAGTSLPEVATSVMAAVRGQRDLAVGNVVGSSIFNLLGVLGLSALVAPVSLPVPAALLTFDIPVMVAVSVACLPIFFTGNLIARWEGALFFGYYVAYTAYLVLAAQDHDALSTYGFAMQAFVLPLTAVTLLLIGTREWVARRRRRAARRDGAGGR